MPKKSPAYTSANEVLFPLLRVLVAAGLKEQELHEICARHVRQIAQKSGRRRLKPLAYRGPLEDIISRWNTDPTFFEVDAPAELSFVGKRSFRSLVNCAAPRMSATEALKELRRHRVVSLSRKKRIRLLSRYFPARATNAIDIELFKRMTIDFLRTHEFNFLRNPRRGEGLFQRIAHNSRIDCRIAPLFNRYARQHGQALLEAVDDWLARRERRVGVRKRTESVRLGLGIYVINESIR